MLTRNLMRAFFRALYHPFAFAYDFVAASVSFGQWKDWGRSVLPFVNGTRVLELGFGPGHLQRFLHTLRRDPSLTLFGIDESRQMARLAKRRVGARQRLVRGLAQALPYPTEIFDCVVATFPTEYIFAARTLSEVKRVLRRGGRLIVLPAAFPSGRFLQWLYRITGQSPAALDEILQTKLKAPFVQAGFDVKVELLEVKFSVLLVVVAEKDLNENR